jgi:hypothetical protein
VVSPIHHEGVEIGDVCITNLKRLRFDGEKLIDILQLEEIWLDEANVVHCMNVEEKCKLVKVNDKYRKKLIRDLRA